MRVVIPRNNLDWLRLLFAAQVVIVHAGEHIGFRVPEFIGHFPGVPAFFFVSGFLIYASYLNAPGKQYFRNRFLRLYPGLLFVTLGSMAIALFAHGWNDLAIHLRTYGSWFIAQMTLGQAYNPSLFRDVGVGAINGSLWTITTELLFYCAVPLIVRIESRVRYTVLILSVLSFAVYVVGPHIFNRAIYRDKTLYNIIALTPVAWGWMFGVGILTFKHFEQIRAKAKYLLLAIIPLAALMLLDREGPLLGSVGNRLGLIYFLAYIAVVFWVSFFTPYRRLGADFSYGVYIWHMPVINFILFLGMSHYAALAAFLGTAVISMLSWFMVEKPALKLKKRSLKSVSLSTQSSLPGERHSQPTPPVHLPY